MDDFTRYAIYYAPPPGPLVRVAAAWLGWDAEAGIAVAQPDPMLAALTGEPRRYGFHGTIKAPFRLAEGLTRADLSAALARFCERAAPLALPGLHLAQIGGFLALVPRGDANALIDLAARLVTGLDPCRAPLTPADIARRHPERLTARQRELLATYGYPYVLEEFRFHLTLSDSLQDRAVEMSALQALATAILLPHVPQPFPIDSLCLFGQAASGQFHLLERHALTG